MSDEHVHSSQRLPARKAAEYLGIGEQTLAAWRCSGRYNLPYSKVGRLIQYSREDLDRWLAERTGTNTRQIARATA